MTRVEHHVGSLMKLPPPMNPDAVSKLILGLQHKNMMTVYVDSEALLE